jgi:hypothetical protein
MNTQDAKSQSPLTPPPKPETSRALDRIMALLRKRERETDRMLILKAPIWMEQKVAMLRLVSEALLEDRRRRTLEIELREAGRAWGEELSVQNFARLQDVRCQLAKLDGPDVHPTTAAGKPTPTAKPSASP